MEDNVEKLQQDLKLTKGNYIVFSDTGMDFNNKPSAYSHLIEIQDITWDNENDENLRFIINGKTNEWVNFLVNVKDGTISRAYWKAQLSYSSLSSAGVISYIGDELSSKTYYYLDE